MADDVNGIDLKPLKVQQQITDSSIQELKAKQLLSDVERDRLTTLQKQYSDTAKIIKSEERRLKISKDTNSGFASLTASYKALSVSVKKQLESNGRSASLLHEMNRELARQESIESNSAGIIKKNAELRAQSLRDEIHNLTEQAVSTAETENSIRGISEFQQKIQDIEDRRADIGDRIANQLIAAVRETQLLSDKKQRLLAIDEMQSDLLQSAPQSIQSAVSFTKKFVSASAAGAIPWVLIGSVLVAAISYFTDIQKAASDFRKESGMLASQTKEIDANVNNIVGDYARLGVEAADVYDIVTEYKNQFSGAVDLTEDATRAMVILNKNFGVSSEALSGVQNVFENIGGLTSDTAANVQLQTVSMAKLAGVAPDKVFKDIANNAEVTSEYFHGDIQALTKAAVQAARLGSSITDMAKTAESMLDFETGIEDELNAQAIAGGNFNLTQARSLAAAGDMVGMQNEILTQLERNGDFQNQSIWAQKAMAQAAGMSVDEISKQLNMRKKLAGLSEEDKKNAEEAMARGLDLSNIKKGDLKNTLAQYNIQQEQQSQLEQLENLFKGIAATLGSTISPLLAGLIPIINLIMLPVQAIAEGFSIIVNFLKENIALAITLGGVLGVVFAKSIGTAIASIWSSIVGMLGPFGIPIAIAAGIGMISMVGRAMSKAGDVFSPADGKTQISTKEGGLYELSPNDDVIAAPGLAKGLSGTIGMGGNVVTAGVNQTINLEPLMVEIKALHNDLISGKIAVYLDGKKITKNIESNVSSQTSNAYVPGAPVSTIR
jgi:hypothetical protein